MVMPGLLRPPEKFAGHMQGESSRMCPAFFFVCLRGLPGKGRDCLQRECLGAYVIRPYEKEDFVS